MDEKRVIKSKLQLEWNRSKSRKQSFSRWIWKNYRKFILIMRSRNLVTYLSSVLYFSWRWNDDEQSNFKGSFKKDELEFIQGQIAWFVSTLFPSILYSLQ